MLLRSYKQLFPYQYFGVAFLTLIFNDMMPDTMPIIKSIGIRYNTKVVMRNIVSSASTINTITVKVDKKERMGYTRLIFTMVKK